MADGADAVSRRGLGRLMVALSVASVGLTGCVKPAEPAPAVIRDSPPPWDAPRDAISHIRLTELPELGLDDTTDPHIVQVEVLVDGQKVALPPYIGIDRLRAVQAPVHTHDDTGAVWLEGRGNREVTLGQFFELWGVRFDDRCLGATCGGVKVTADGRLVSEPTDLVLRGLQKLTIQAS